jgi:Flp pilus assembly protein TadD
VSSKRAKTKDTEAKNVKSENTRGERRSYSLFTSHYSLLTTHCLCLVFLVVVIYANTLNAPFQWDESDFIVNNPIIKDLHYFSNPSDAKGFKLYSSFIGRYIGYLTFALNYRVHGLSVTGYHIVNIAIHIANSIMVYFLVLLTFRTPYFKTVNGEEVNSEWSPPPIPPPPGGRVREGGHVSRFTIHDSRPLIAFFSAAIFAVHPLQTEAVTYVFQRFASLVTFFYLLSLVFYIKARLLMGLKTDSGQAGMTKDGAVSFIFFLISFLSAVLAMKTKENAFTLPVMITLYEFCFFSRFTSHVSRFLYLVPILLTLLIVPLTLMSLAGSHKLDPTSYGVGVSSPRDYFFTQFRVIVTYLRLLFFPVDQNLDYDYPIFKSFFDPPVILSFLFLAAFFALGIWLVIKTKDNTKENDSGQAGIVSRFTSQVSRRSSRFSGLYSRFTSHVSRPLRLMGFGILWFFITLSVESSIIPLPMLIDEYRVYLPSVGLIISAVTGVFLLFSRFTAPPHFPPPQGGRVSEGGHHSLFTIHHSRFLLMFLVVAVGVLSVATYLRNSLWADPAGLWEDVVRKSPANARAHNNLGVIYQNLNMPDKAMEQYLTVIMLKPDYTEAHYNLGTIYQARNMFDKAMEHYLIALKLKPDYAKAHNNLGIIYYQVFNMPDKAEEEFLSAVKLNPNDARMHFNLGFVYYKMGQIENARRELAEGLNINPDDQLGQQLLKTVNR